METIFVGSKPDTYKLLEDLRKNTPYFFGMDYAKRTTPKTVPEIKQVIYNNPATIIIWSDNSKTVVKTHNEEFDEEHGFAMAYLKKVFGGRNPYMKYIENAQRPVEKVFKKEAVKESTGKTDSYGNELFLGDIVIVENWNGKDEESHICKNKKNDDYNEQYWLMGWAARGIDGFKKDGFKLKKKFK